MQSQDQATLNYIQFKIVQLLLEVDGLLADADRIAKRVTLAESHFPGDLKKGDEPPEIRG
jgi:hypothetical protein